MYIRFITEYINEHGENETGLFSALQFIREAPSTQDADISKLNHIREWFNQNLDAPNKLSNAGNKNPGYIIYSDDYQVSAIPFKNDRKKVL